MSIKIEHVVLPSSEQMNFIIEGMRNPKNSWGSSDSVYSFGFKVGAQDQKLMCALSKAGTAHRKYMRMMPVYCRITAPLYWWKEFDTYKVGTVANSCSTMHKIMDHEFTRDDFSFDRFIRDDILGGQLEDQRIISNCNKLRDAYMSETDEKKKKDIWNTLIQYLPSSYNQTRNVMLNYEVLANIYPMRKNHRLIEWREFCAWIVTLPLSNIITNSKAANDE